MHEGYTLVIINNGIHDFRYAHNFNKFYYVSKNYNIKIA